MENITIRGKEYPIKYTLRALFIYEQITGETFNPKNTIESYLFYYCIILANNPSFEYTFKDFISICDEDVTIAIKLQTFLVKEMDKQAQIINKEFDEEKEDVKKN